MEHKENKIDLFEVQNMLEWLKKKIYLNTIVNKAKKRIFRRGEVYLCDFGVGVGSEIRKNRPCVIIQGNVGNIHSSNVIVAPITHTEKDIPSVCKIETQINLNDNTVILNGYINLSNIQTVSKARLGDFVTKLTNRDIVNMDNAILVSLGLIKQFKELNNKIEKQAKYIEKLKNN